MNMLEEISPTAPCDMVLLVQAEFDGELDAAQAANLQSHRRLCRDCQSAERGLTHAHSLLHEELYQPMPDAIRQRILARLDADQSTPVLQPADGWRRRPPNPAVLSRFRSWRHSTIGFGFGVACAAAAIILVVNPAERNLTEQLVAGHVRALQPGHLEDVASTDQHTVKPWFDGRIDFAPPVKNLGAAGFPLTGGRLDFIAGRPVAALIYRHDKHIIDMFIWPTAGSLLPALEPAERNGYNLVHWSQSGMEFWVVSDLERSQLSDFAQDWQRSP